MKINVPDMHCKNCTDRISAALKKQGIEADISLEAQEVSVDAEKAQLAKDIIYSLGFSPEIAE